MLLGHQNDTDKQYQNDTEKQNISIYLRQGLGSVSFLYLILKNFCHTSKSLSNHSPEMRKGLKDMALTEPVLSIDFRKEYSTGSDSVVTTKKLSISIEAIHSGLIAKLGAKKFAIMMAIVSHMNDSGQCFPSQERLAELTGVSRATIQRHLQELTEIEYQGQKLLHKQLVGDKKKKTVYTFSAGEVTNTDLVAEEPVTTGLQMNSKDFVFYFADKFREHFGEGHTPNFSREGAVFKRLLSSYEPHTLKEIIDVVFELYKEKWFKPQYPHPTPYQLSSWLADEAYKIVRDRKEQEQKQAQRLEQAVKQDDTDRALDLFDI